MTSLTGQCLMCSLLTSLSPASSQLRPGCQADRQPEQNWLTHVGHVTGLTSHVSPGHTWQMVWQSGAGHHVRPESRVTSVSSLCRLCLSRSSLGTREESRDTLMVP